MIERIVVDALQVGAEPTGVGTQAVALGEQLTALGCPWPLEVRCPAATRPLLVPAYPAGTVFCTPLPGSRPRLRRIAWQQLAGPLRDGPGTLLVGLGDQGPLWGRARLCLVLNDVRRLALPSTTTRGERLFYGTLTPRAARRAAAVLTISEFSRAEALRLLGVEATVAAHHPRPAAAQQGDAAGPLLAVGALRPYKGLDTAIEALALLDPVERRPLVLAGPEETPGEAARLLALAHARGVADLVRITGWLQPGQLAALRAAAAATVNPSRYEGYGLGLAESLAAGLPTVASDIPPHRELAGPDGSLLFPAGDAAALAAALRGALAARQRLGAAALARSRELAAVRPTLAEAVLELAARL